MSQIAEEEEDLEMSTSQSVSEVEESLLRPEFKSSNQLLDENKSQSDIASEEGTLNVLVAKEEPKMMSESLESEKSELVSRGTQTTDNWIEEIVETVLQKKIKDQLHDTSCLVTNLLINFQSQLKQQLEQTLAQVVDKTGKVKSFVEEEKVKTINCWEEELVGNVLPTFRNRKLFDTRFFVMTSQVEVIAEEWRPTEVTLILFSIREGIQKEWHRSGFELEDSLTIGKEMKKFIQKNSQSSRPLILVPRFLQAKFIRDNQVEQNKRVLNWLVGKCQEADSNFSLFVKGFDLITLIQHIAVVRLHPKRRKVFEKRLQSKKFESVDGISCQLHEKCENCSLKTARQWTVNFLELIRPMFMSKPNLWAYKLFRNVGVKPKYKV